VHQTSNVPNQSLLPAHKDLPTINMMQSLTPSKTSTIWNCIETQCH